MQIYLGLWIIQPPISFGTIPCNETVSTTWEKFARNSITNIPWFNWESYHVPGKQLIILKWDTYLDRCWVIETFWIWIRGYRYETNLSLHVKLIKLSHNSPSGQITRCLSYFNQKKIIKEVTVNNHEGFEGINPCDRSQIWQYFFHFTYTTWDCRRRISMLVPIDITKVCKIWWEKRWENHQN